jgi:two-component system, NarL family, sensor histidine kinase LiaS
MSDNGIGFDLKKLHDRGMGLNNVQSRIRPYNGEVEIISKPGKGTKYEISIPLGNKQ